MKIRQLCAFLLSLLTTFISSAAQGSQSDSLVAVDYFYNAPSEVASYLTPVDRLDMIDYYKSGSTVGTENRLGSKVRILSMDDRHVTWQDDDSVRTTLVVLPAQRLMSTFPLLVVIRTFAGVMPDSDVFYYEEDWDHPLKPSDYPGLPNPELKDWLVSKDKKTRAVVEEAIPFMLWTAEYDLESDELIFTNRMADFFAPGDKPTELGKLKPELRYQWTGKRFKWFKSV